MNTTMPVSLSLSSPPHAGERDKGSLRESHFKEAT